MLHGVPCLHGVGTAINMGIANTIVRYLKLLFCAMHVMNKVTTLTSVPDEIYLIY
jgi:hypothetical protein